MYYYFEINLNNKEKKEYSNSLCLNGPIFKPNIKQYQHYNELKYLPHTSSSGNWGCDHYHSKMQLTESGENKYLPYKYISQYWVDINKYKKGYDVFIDYFIDNIIPLLSDTYCEKC